jgi:hypothetical protein
MTYRKVGLLIAGLPPESLTATAIRNDITPEQMDSAPESEPEKGQWSQAEMLLASLVDEFRWLHHDYIAANSQNGSNLKAPSPTPRPGVKSPARRKKMTAEQRNRLQRQREEGGHGT